MATFTIYWAYSVPTIIVASSLEEALKKCGSFDSMMEYEINPH